MARRCSICTNEKKNEWVARRHLEGYSAHRMEEMARASGHPMKRETISKHLRTCIGSDAKPAEVKAVAESVQATVCGPTEDVAVLVQKEVVRKLQAGEGRVTVQHGLAGPAVARPPSRASEGP